MTETYITLDQARVRVVVLASEIDWIESVIDEKVRNDLELNIEAPPEDVQMMLAQMISDKMKEKARFEDAIRYATETLKLISPNGKQVRFVDVD